MILRMILTLLLLSVTSRWSLPAMLSHAPVFTWGRGGYKHQCKVRHTHRIFFCVLSAFCYCVFLTRITYCVLRIAYDCNFHIQPTLTRFAYCVLRVAYGVLASPL